MLKFCVALTTLLLALADIQSAGAQRLRGRLLDLDTDQPLVAGLLTLMTADRASLITAVTDTGGYWEFEIPAAGFYFIAARRLGYQPWLAGPVEATPGADVDFVFHLRRLAIQLTPVEVSAEAVRRYLAATGFYDRQRADFGFFLTPERIERRQASRITDLLTGLPGVRLITPSVGSAGPRSVQLRGSNLSQGTICRPRVFVDGIIYAQGDARPRTLREGTPETERAAEQIRRMEQGVSLDDIGHPSTIAAIEIYRSATQVPVQFGGTSVETLCGVIVVWTRSGTMRSTTTDPD